MGTLFHKSGVVVNGVINGFLHCFKSFSPIIDFFTNMC